MKKRHFIYLIFFLFLNCNEKKEVIDLAKEEAFFKEQKKLATVWKYLNNNFSMLHSLNQSGFTKKIDSLNKIYSDHLQKNKNNLRLKTYRNEVIAIRAAFDEYILKYPNLHLEFTGEKVILSNKNKQRIQLNLPYFNKPEFLLNKDLIRFTKTYITIESRKKLQSGVYDQMDNQQLLADWMTIESLFNNSKVNTFWKQEYLSKHIDQMGIKNIYSIYNNFVSKSTDSLTKLTSIYNLKQKKRASHTIEIYKKVDNHQLEMHLFLPDTKVFKGTRPTMVHFHGGSWSIGTPDWFFETAEEYAKKGWIVAVVEYRIKGKQGTYPFAAVKDAKSAIRWLRENIKKYPIDPTRILATGNSAGGHLSLATTLVENWNEKTDNLQTSAKPNVVIVNSAAYNLTHRNAKWIAENLEDKNVVKEISPYHLAKKTTTKILLIHGEKDKNCPYSNANYFYKKMKSLGNDIQLHTVKDATHFLWFGNYPEVAKITAEYIEQKFY